MVTMVCLKEIITINRPYTKMEYHEKRIQSEKGYFKNLNSYIPEWAKLLVELYTSPLKYKMKDELNLENVYK